MRWFLRSRSLGAWGLAYAQQLELHFIDVGQGDAVLIRSPTGQNVLYDGVRPATVVFEYLESVGVSSPDLVIASHPDADYIGGLRVRVVGGRTGHAFIWTMRLWQRPTCTRS